MINFDEVNVREALLEMTGGIGPDACIAAVGLESQGGRISMPWHGALAAAVARLGNAALVSRRVRFPG